MAKYTMEDYYADDLDVVTRSHIVLHLIRDYEQQVYIPMLAKDDYPLDDLQHQAYSSQVQGASFDARFAQSIQDAETGEVVDATCGPLILCGIYEGFSMLMTGYDVGAVPVHVVVAYGSMMVACARPYFYQLSECAE